LFKNWQRTFCFDFYTNFTVSNTLSIWHDHEILLLVAKSTTQSLRESRLHC